MVKNNIHIVIILVIALCSLFIYKIFYFQGNLISIENTTSAPVRGEVIFQWNKNLTVPVENLQSGDSYRISIQKHSEWSIWLRIFQEDKKLIEGYISSYYESAFNEYFEIIVSEKNGKVQVQGMEE